MLHRANVQHFATTGVATLADPVSKTRFTAAPTFARVLTAPPLSVMAAPLTANNCVQAVTQAAS